MFHEVSRPFFITFWHNHPNKSPSVPTFGPRSAASSFSVPSPPTPPSFPLLAVNGGVLIPTINSRCSRFFYRRSRFFYRRGRFFSRRSRFFYRHGRFFLISIRGVPPASSRSFPFSLPLSVLSRSRSLGLGALPSPPMHPVFRPFPLLLQSLLLQNRPILHFFHLFSQYFLPERKSRRTFALAIGTQDHLRR